VYKFGSAGGWFVWGGDLLGLDEAVDTMDDTMLLDCVEVDSMTRLSVSESGSGVYLLRRSRGELDRAGPSGSVSGCVCHH
jgi:hypothetical protein